MNEKVALSLRLELFWWLFTSLVVFGVLFPILNKVDAYPFLWINIVYIIVFITFTRYVFLLKHTFLAHLHRLKAFIIILSIPVIFYLINGINYFQTFLDEKGLDSFLSHLSIDEVTSMGSYIRNEMLLFGVGSTVIAIILPIRMVVSLWRWRNRGTV
ncbi:MAG: hypothetical protein AAF985_21730 [Bacteroidota bacterium]